MAKKDNKELLKRLRERFKRCMDNSTEIANRQLAISDLKFVNVPGEQWDEVTKKERGNDRPMYEFNKLRITIKRVVNDMRANRPQGKVRGVEDNDKDTAEVYEGLCRNIWNVSDGDTVIDYAAEYQVGGGMGAWRVSTKYSSDEAFEQDISVEQIKNPFNLYADPSCQDPLKRDAHFWFLVDRINKDVFEAKYPDKEPVNFEDSQFDDDGDWQDEDSVRICEYWWKEPVTKQLCLLSSGATIDKLVDSVPRGTKVIKERSVKAYQIKTAICSGDAVLEGPSDWAGTEFPFVIVYGEYIVIDGKTHWFGLTRFAKDAQRSYNYSRTAITETIALAPQAKWWATTEQAKGHTEQWAEAHKLNRPFMLFNADPKQAGAPQRMGGPDVPIALIQESQIASDEIKAVTGIFDPSLGNQSNETSGIAIRQRQQQGEIATFNYSDNLAKGIRRTWEILIDLIPKIYDTQRAVRILGADGAEKYIKVNSIDENGQAVNDLARGKYDVTITVGPSFSTQRQEAVEAYTAIGQSNPVLWQAAGDLMFKAMDLPYSDQIAERWKAMLPPQIQQTLNQDGKQSPEVQAAMMQAQQAMSQVEQHGQLVQQAAQEAQQEKAEADKAKSDVQLAQANLKVQAAQLQTQQAQLEAQFAKMQADLAKQQTALDGSQAGAEGANQATQLAIEQMQQASQAIQAEAQAFIQQAAQVIGALNVMPLVIEEPKQKVMRVKRVNGELIGTVEEIGTGGPAKQVNVRRINGELVGTIQ